MSHIVEDRVLETSTTIGISPYVLLGAVTGYRAASTVCVDLDTFKYYAEEINSEGALTGSWEIGLGTWGTGNTLARTTIYSSSNNNNLVSWNVGTRRVGLSVVTETFNEITSDFASMATSLINTQTLLVTISNDL